jgi:hypothetical protein
MEHLNSEISLERHDHINDPFKIVGRARRFVKFGRNVIHLHPAGKGDAASPPRCSHCELAMLRHSAMGAHRVLLDHA